MKCLDLCCGAGGASMGYYLAGFSVVGVDIAPQSHYPFEFIQGDGLQFLKAHGHDFDLIHVSPPCQQYSKATNSLRKNDGKQYPDLIGPFRGILIDLAKPYVIENVPGSPLIEPIFLNGYMFGLLVHRPRYFECNFPVRQLQTIKTKSPIKMGRPIKDGDIIQPVGHFSGIEYAKQQMQIDWMVGAELAQAIPPAYTQYIGQQWRTNAIYTTI